MSEAPLVTLGLPVLNGGSMIAAALDSIVMQDYPNLEVIVSDNASTDNTSEILQSYKNRYPFIRIVRQKTQLSAIDNFMFVLREARGDFFAWCAHDDRRSANFVSGLLSAFNDPQTVLAFGDLRIWDGKNPPVSRTGYDFANVELMRWQRLRKAALMQCYHIYGLWRTRPLRSLDIRYANWWPDLPIMMGMTLYGSYRYIPGVTFCYYEVPKTTAQRATYQGNSISPIRNLLDVFRGCFVTVTRNAGAFAGLLALLFVIEKFSRQLWIRHSPFSRKVQTTTESPQSM